MIQLYKRTNSKYTSNGDFIIKPESCVLESKINDTWVLTLDYPYEKSEIFESIVNEAVIAVPTPNSAKQLFRIYDTTKNDDGITALARPIFLDAANDTMLLNTSITSQTGQMALDTITSNTKYSGESNILKPCNAKYIRKNLIEVIASDDENSFLNKWGGEIEYDNYKIIINSRIGEDNGVRVEFGKNLESIEESVNVDNVVTRIIPVAYNGRTLPGNTPWVDSPLINNYAVVRTRVIEYSDIKLKEECTADETGYTLAELQAKLRTRCNLEYAKDIDKPLVNYKINMVDLAQTEEYKDYKILETVRLGDTIHCKNKNLNIDTDARVISTQWDCINKRYNEIELGNFSKNFLDDMQSTIQHTQDNFTSDGKVKGESIAGMIDLMKTKMKATREIAKKQIERAILFEDKDTDSPTYGAMALGTTGFQIADSQNSSGDWIWSTFGTGQGFYADCLVAGAIYSQNYIENTQGFKIDLNTGLINAFKLAWQAQNSSMTENGSFTCKSGEIGGWNVNDSGLYKSVGNYSIHISSNMTSDINPVISIMKDGETVCSIHANGYVDANKAYIREFLTSTCEASHYKTPLGDGITRDLYIYNGSATTRIVINAGIITEVEDNVYD